jgi:hypothetical protein
LVKRRTETVERIIHPVESELCARSGHELGSRLNSQFVTAFEGPGALEEMHLETPISGSRRT